MTLDPANNQYTLQAHDLAEQEKAFDEFDTRAKAITDSIALQGQVVRKLQEYLEKQMILDFHFRGEQDIFEAEYENLIPKA